MAPGNRSRAGSRSNTAAGPARGFSTPRGSSKIRSIPSVFPFDVGAAGSRMDDVQVQKGKEKTPGSTYRLKDETNVHQEEFYSRDVIPKLEKIKRKLDFNILSPTSDFQSSSRLTSSSGQAGKLRSGKKVRSNPEERELERDVKPSVQVGRKTRRKVDVCIIDPANINAREMEKDLWVKSEAGGLANSGAELASTLPSSDRKLINVPVDISEAACDSASAELLGAQPYDGPFPNFSRPMPLECRAVRDLLSNLHGHLEEYAKRRISSTSGALLLTADNHGGSNIELQTSNGNLALIGRKKRRSGVQAAVVEGSENSSHENKVVVGDPIARNTVLDSLVGTLLSQNTTEKNSRRAFAALKTAFPTWEEVQAADARAVEDSIKCGGLAERKALQIRSILDSLLKERGKICMEYIHSMSSEKIKLELSRFKGVGPKTVACVLMFHLKRNEFPVDTHVFRISKMLGWVPKAANREKSYLHLNQRIPDALKFDLHCLFVTHGRRCKQCAKNGRNQQPADGPCPLAKSLQH